MMMLVALPFKLEFSSNSKLAVHARRWQSEPRRQGARHGVGLGPITTSLLVVLSTRGLKVRGVTAVALGAMLFVLFATAKATLVDPAREKGGGANRSQRAPPYTLQRIMLAKGNRGPHCLDGR